MKTFASLFLALALLVSSVHAAELALFTEEYPPFNHIQQGRLTGTSTELLLQAFERAGAPLKREDIQLVPWARAYQMALRVPETCVYSTTRTSEREAKFHWVGPLCSTEVVLAALEGTPELQDLSEVGQAKVGVVRDDVGHQLLLEKGLLPGQLDITHTAESNIRKLFMGRIKYYAYDYNVLQAIARQLGDVDPGLLVPVYTLSKAELYLACNLNTDQELLTRLQHSVEALLAEDDNQVQPKP